MSAASVTMDPIDLDHLSLASFAARPVAVLGMARSGIALARFLADQGADVTVYDGRAADELAGAIAALEGRHVRARLGPEVDPSEVLRGQALVCTSPAISSRFPTTEPRLRAALAALEAEGRVPLVSEIDLFLRLCPATTIGVTGTKGKTTTSSLAAAILARGPRPVLLGGNIGTPLVERLPELTPAHLVVLELSELQLPTMSRGTDLAVYTHVSADHLDRHGSLEAYRAVKRRLAELLRPDGLLVLNADDPVVSAYDSPTGARIVRYRAGEPAAGEVGIVDGWIAARALVTAAQARVDAPAEASDARVVALEDIPLPGEHSVGNVLAAVTVGLLLGIGPDAIRDAVVAFPGVEHRLQTVATVDGVRFVNDSMGTQPEAVMAALRSFPAPLVLIAGGRDKGLEIDELAQVVAERVDAAVLIGESGPALGTAFRAAGLKHTEAATTLEAAVERADAIARERHATGAHRPATVLLSPAAASFDMFVDYAERGRVFEAAVHQLAARRERGDAP